MSEKITPSLHETISESSPLQLYETIFKHAPVGIEIYDHTGLLIDANRKCLLIFGITDIASIKAFNLFNDPNISDEHKTILKEGGSVSFETSFDFDLVTNRKLYPTSKSGSILLNVTIEPVKKLLNEQASGYVALVEEITEGKLAEKSLLQSELRYRELVENLWDIVFSLDPEGRITYISPRIAVYGYDPVKSISKPILEFIHPDDRRTALERLKAKLATGTETPYASTYRALTADGRTIWIEESDRLQRDDQGTVIGFRGIIRDVTEIKEHQEELRASEERYKKLFSEMKSGYILNQIILDKAGKPVDYCTIDMNPAAEMLLGLKKEDVIGIPVGPLLPPDEFAEWLSIFSEVTLTGKGAHYEQYSPANNKLFEGHAYSPLPGRFAVIFDDVTARKQAEEILQNAQKLESLGILAGGIAHDFNNLLGGIYGFIEMAQERTTDDIIAQYLDKVMRTIDRGRGLTQQLLTFSKGGAPKQVVGYLFPFVRETVQFALSGSNCSCKFNVPRDLWACNYDANQIGQVIDNIIINAKQATPSGGMIEVEAGNVILGQKQHPVLHAGNYVRISIKDCGIGMPKEILPRIFDPFFTTKSAGHGLGLATSYSIVKRHGGCIDVTSEPGKGSTFSIFLPVATGSAAVYENTLPSTFRGSGTFLVMDDELVMREIASAMLASFGYTPVCAINGYEAVVLCKEEVKAKRPIAGAILDLTVPGSMGGKETVIELRNQCPGLAVFVTSGYAEDPILASPEEYGFNASISKPFRKSELLELLRKHMGKSR
jgi:PAS domain S-box-containing protein